MGSDDILSQLIQDTQFVEPFPWAAAMLLEAVIDLALCLTHVDVQGNPQFFAGISATEEALPCDGVDGVWGNRESKIDC